MKPSSSDTTRTSRLKRLAPAFYALGTVAAIFASAVALTLAAAEIQHRQRAPLDLGWAKPLFQSAQGSAAEAPDSAAALARLDALARRAYFSHMAFREQGLLLLLAGLLVTGLSLGTWHALTRSPTDPRTFGGAPQPNRSRSRQTTALAATAALGALAVVALRLAPAVAPSHREKAATVAGSDVVQDTEPPPSPATVSAWPSFRGPRGDGVAQHPISEPKAMASAEPQWRTPLQRPGFSSPVVGGSLVFLTAGDADSRDVLAFDLESGEPRWTTSIPFAAPPGSVLPNVTDDTGHAASSPAADSERVYAVFATGDLAALDHDGTLRWNRNLGVPANPYGHASSLLLHEGMLLVQYDNGEGGRALALRATDGKTLWDIGRDVHTSWASPTVLPHPEQPLLLLNAPDFTAAYHLRDGSPAWSVEALTGEVAPSPAVSENRLFLAQEYSRMVAFDLSATPPALLWEAYDELPDIASPVAGHGSVWITSTYGAVSCHDAATGELRWRHQYDDGFNASPILAGGTLLLLDLEGHLRFLATGDSFEELAVLPLGDEAFATPALLDDRIIIRTRTQLLCFATHGQASTSLPLPEGSGNRVQGSEGYPPSGFPEP